ncbi:HET domain-containing protein [Fusarium keratoplasticum]|nr:HET domain-containing protein [Fusarium keratoplasticum]
MGNSCQRYSYQPLAQDSIRLITIKPGPWDSIIECEVDIRKLGEGGSSFRALSYVWGDSNVRCTIHLNGNEFGVTVNLFEGLRQIRESMFKDGTLRQLPIWADAICISQEDNEEKVKQIPKMHDIYNTAEEVLLRLGVMPIPPNFVEPCIGDDRLRPLLGFSDEDRSMSEELREKVLQKYVRYAHLTELQHLYLGPRLSVRYQLMFAAIASALRRCSYFQRVWTVQEAVLAKDDPIILVSRHVLSWHEFARINDERVNQRSEVSKGPHTSFPGISSLRVQRARGEARLVHHRLLDLIQDFSDLACTEAVDKIYGLLAMVPLHSFPERRFPKSLRPNYNIPCEEVYWKYAEYIFNTTGDLRLLDKYLREMSMTGHNYGVCVDRMERPSNVLRPGDLDLVGTSMDLRDTMCQLRERILGPLAQSMDLSEMKDFCSGHQDFAECALEGWKELAAFAWASLRTSKGENNYVLPSVYQGNYSAITHKAEEELFPLLRKLGVAFYAYSPIAGGVLAKSPAQIKAGGMRFSPDQMYGLYHQMYVKDALLDALDDWEGIPTREGVSKAELAYRWIVHHSELKGSYGDGVVVGASRPSQLEETLSFCDGGPLTDAAVEGIQAIWDKVKDCAPTDNCQAVRG